MGRKPISKDGKKVKRVLVSMTDETVEHLEFIVGAVNAANAAKKHPAGTVATASSVIRDLISEKRKRLDRAKVNRVGVHLVSIRAVNRRESGSNGAA